MKYLPKPENQNEKTPTCIAADGATESDLSGTKVASFPDLALVGGAQKFIDKNDSGWNPALFQSVRNQDFEARYDRVRYDAPAFGPVKLAVSQGYKGDQDITEVAATYNTAIDGLGRLSAAVGYSTRDVGGAAGDVEHKVIGSDVEIYGAAYVYQPIKRLDVYFAYNNFALDADNGDYDDVNIAMIGSRLKF